VEHICVAQIGSHWLGSPGHGPVETRVVSWYLMIDDALLHW